MLQVPAVAFHVPKKAASETSVVEVAEAARAGTVASRGTAQVPARAARRRVRRVSDMVVSHVSGAMARGVAVLVTRPCV
ncbi:hypothetical protein SHO565_59490 [Streptomyces sp. HO565]